MARMEETIIMRHARADEDLWEEIEDLALARLPKRLSKEAPLYPMLYEAALLDAAIRLLSPRLMPEEHEFPI